MTNITQKCYKCHQNKSNCQIVIWNWNQGTLAYSLGENTYICKDCDYLLKVGEIMGKYSEINDCY